MTSAAAMREQARGFRELAESLERQADLLDGGEACQSTGAIGVTSCESTTTKSAAGIGSVAISAVISELAGRSRKRAALVMQNK